MKLNPKIRRGLILSAWILASTGVVVLLGFVNQREEEMPCKGVAIRIIDQDEQTFIDQPEVLHLINTHRQVVGQAIGSINTSMLEKTILSNPYVQSVEVYSSIDGMLHADVRQRTPVVRIINMHDEQFYIDTEGKFMPVSMKYTAPALVANGYIFNTYSEMKVDSPKPVRTEDEQDSAVIDIPRVVNQVYALASYVAADTFWSANAEQIYVNEHQELELIPRAGDHRILIGDTTDLSDKFRRLMIFYTAGLSKTGWNNYSVINLKYRDQVVCTKK